MNGWLSVGITSLSPIACRRLHRLRELVLYERLWHNCWTNNSTYQWATQGSQQWSNNVRRRQQSYKTQSLMESTGETWLTVLQHKAERGWYRHAERCHPLWKGGKSVVRPHPARGRFEMWCVQIFFFCINKEYFILQCLKSCFAAITYQIKHCFDFSNCKFTRSLLISAIWRGSPCWRSSDDANTDRVHCLSPRCRVKW